MDIEEEEFRKKFLALISALGLKREKKEQQRRKPTQKESKEYREARKAFLKAREEYRIARKRYLEVQKKYR